LKFAVLLAIVAVGVVPVRAGAQPQATPSRLSLLSAEFRQLARKVNPAVVRVSSIGYRQLDEDESDERGVASRQQSSGAGVIISPDGYIVTNAHVVLGAQIVQVTVLSRSAAAPGRPGGPEIVRRKALRAELVGLDLETDIALLKVSEKGMPALRLADSDSVDQGQIVFAFGSPLGLDNSVSMGVVSSTARQFKPDDPMVYLQTDASINPGNSGGPVVDAAGDVVGISTLILSQSGGSEGLGFAVPSNVVINVVEQLRETGRVVRGEIGVVVQTISPALSRGWKLPRDWGVVVADVDPESEAARAGLQVADVIQTLNGRLVETSRQFDLGLYRPARSGTVRLEVLRGGAHLNFNMKVRERNDDERNYSDLASREENLIPELGIFAIDLTDRLRARIAPERHDHGGVLVASREADGPALEDNFQSGDVLYALNREQVKNVAGLRTLVKKLKAGDPVAVQVERLGKLRFVSFELP
jgi:serine protease Do